MNHNDPDNADAPLSPVHLGDNPEELEFGVGAKDGRVIVRFNTMVQWFNMDPALAIAFAEKIIDCAEEAARPRPSRSLLRASAADVRKHP
jgi:hypothetical protein